LTFVAFLLRLNVAEVLDLLFGGHLLALGLLEARIGNGLDRY
jgi:hypothetical protein